MSVAHLFSTGSKAFKRPAWYTASVLFLLAVVMGVMSLPCSASDNDNPLPSIPSRGLWDRAYTELIRSSLPDHWGNWTLDMAIEPGAVGYIEFSTGKFVRLGMLPKALTTTNPLSSTMKLASDGVQSSQEYINLPAGAPIAPTTSSTTTATAPASITGKPNVGLKVSWSFPEKDTLATNWVLQSQELVDQPVSVMKDNMVWLQQQAGQVDMYNSSTGIEQGFGVITGVIWAKSGMNAGAHSANSTFAISGCVQNIESMLGLGSTGSGDMDGAGAGASFSRYHASGIVNSYIWPADSNTETSALVPIAYTFASVSGTAVIPDWIGKVNGFTVNLDNSKSTYIVETTLNYSVGDPAQPVPEQKVTLTGGTSGTFSDIPLDAQNVTLVSRFIGAVHDQSYTMHWDQPLGHWLTGERTIVMHGYWPGKISCYVAEELPIN